MRSWLVMMALVACIGAATTVVGSRAWGPEAPGDAETDRIAQVVSDAVSFPGQTSAESFHRAVLATRAARDGRLQVVQVDELDAGDLTDPLAHLVYRISHDRDNGALGTGPRFETVVSCYDVHFSYYGIVGSPERTACPTGAGPVPPPPSTAPPPTLVEDAVERLRRGLEGLPLSDRLDPGTVQTTVEDLGLGDATISVGAYDGSVAIALRAGRGCLMARVDAAGTIAVWSPAPITIAPGEGSCNADTASDPEATANPH